MYIELVFLQEICSHIFQTLFNLCRLSRTRQEEAAISGILPLLLRALNSNSPLKEFALPLLCDMVNAGKTARRQLWKAGGVKGELSRSFDEGVLVTDIISSSSLP